MLRTRPDRPRRFGSAHRLLQLAEDLRLAEHHRVEAAGDAERVRHGPLPGMHVQMRPDIVDGQPVIVGQPASDLIGLGGVAIDLGAVAGRQDRRLPRQPLAEQVAQRLGQSVDAKRDLLAQSDRGGLVVKADGVERHGIKSVRMWLILLDLPKRPESQVKPTDQTNIAADLAFKPFGPYY